jgi:cation diffusion facilitator CzcD-associated flavoprotein CzcO
MGTKRVCVDTGYYETFNRDNVTLVDVRTSPIIGFTPTGVKTTSGEYALDVIIYATGFDAMTGSLTRMNVTGIGGEDLREHWVDGPSNYLGFLVAGYPNLIMIHGPGSPSALAPMIMGAERQIDWVTDLLAYMDHHGYERVDTTCAAETSWAREVDDAADKLLYKMADSWYTGANIAGKPRVFMVFVGGIELYWRRCNEISDNDYEGMDFS